MRNLIIILVCWMSCVAMVAQDSARLYVDTMNVGDLVSPPSAEDFYLLELLNEQSKEIARREDSLHKLRLAMDTTTIVPLHLGYADSLKVAEHLRQQRGLTPLCLPPLYHPQPPLHFRPLEYSAKADTAKPLFLSFEAKSVRQEARRYITIHAADLYVGTMNPDKVMNDVEEETKSSVYELQVPEKSLIKDVEADRQEYLNRLKNQRNPWFKELTLLMQFTQNYVSSNWYEGGNSSFSMYGSAKGVLKYDDKKRIAWDNVFEWNEGFATNSGDTVHLFNTSEDLFRLYSKLGVKLKDKLYGSFSVEYRSQVLPTYKTNSKTEKKTTFCTPIRFDLALGLDYKPVKGLSIVAAPAAYKMVYANDTAHVSATSFGIAEGEKAFHKFGASVRVEWVWKPLREVSLETKLYAYKSYLDKSGEVDLEVNCDFIINRFMSARVKLHPRYDSSRKLEGEEKAKMQFKELISIGFSHKFH